MEERTGIITFQGNPLTLLGRALKVGDPAPDFEILDNELQPVRISAFKGKVVIITSRPLPGYAGLRPGNPAVQRRGGRSGVRGADPDHQHGPALCPEALVRRRRNR